MRLSSAQQILERQSSVNLNCTEAFLREKRKQKSNKTDPVTVMLPVPVSIAVPYRLSHYRPETFMFKRIWSKFKSVKVIALC